MGNIVNINGTISHQNSILQQRMSQILLLLMWNNPKEKGVCTGKIFEYLAAKRPIVSYGVVEGCVPTILSETNSGIAVNNKNDLKNLIKMHYNSYKNNGYVEFNSSNKILKFSQKNNGKKNLMNF
nr:hypothetical protein [Methanobacterium formicicum]